MKEVIIISILCGVFGYVVANILTEPEMILHRLYMAMSKLPKWIFKPIIGCSYCVAGQSSLWSYLILNYHNYNFIHHALIITLSIFTVELLTAIINKLNK